MPPRKRLVAGALALCAATILVYSNSFQAGFALDNQALLLQDPRIREATSANVDLILQHSYWWPHGESNLYRPLATLSYLFNYAILGDSGHPEGYHWINLLLHLGNVLLAYALLMRLTRRFWLSLGTAGLWALHPVLTESVTNIVGRPDLLAGAAILSSLLMYGKAKEATGARRWWWLAGVLVATAVGVFSKESAVVIPGLIALYELCWWQGSKSAAVLAAAGVAVLAPIAAMWAQRSAVLARVGPASFPFTDNPLTAAGFWTARLTALKVAARYLGLLVWPAKLSCDYSYPQIPMADGSLLDWLSWGVVGVLLAAVVVLFRRNRTAFFLACFALLAFLPTANLLFPIGTIMAERFLYLPALGFIGCLAVVVDASFHWPKSAVVPVVLVLIACALGLRTWLRNSDWRDNLSLDTAAVETSPKSYKTHAMLASALFAADPDHSNLEQVIAEAERSLAPLDSLPDQHNVARAYEQAGNYYLLKGDSLLQHLPGGDLKPTPASQEAYRRSLAILQRCVRIFQSHDRGHVGDSAAASAGYVDAYRMLATANLRLLDMPRALDAAMRARAMDPGNPATYGQISDILRIEGRPEDAAVALMTGAVFTSDQGLRQDLMGLYRSGLDSQGCALVGGPEGPAINPSCPLVHRDLCAAAEEMIRLHLGVGERDLAAKARAQAVSQFGCTAGPLDQFLAKAPE